MVMKNLNGINNSTRMLLGKPTTTPATDGNSPLYPGSYAIKVYQFSFEWSASLFVSLPV